MLSSNQSSHRMPRGTALKREDIRLVTGTISFLSREADNLEQELTILKQEITEIEGRLKYIAEKWECKKTMRPF